MAPKKERDPELLRKLRERTRRGGESSATSNNDLAQRMRNDPQSALLSMGIDDPEMLKMAASALKHPESALRDLKSQLQNITPQKPEEDDDEAPPPLPRKNDTTPVAEEEEAPPPALW